MNCQFTFPFVSKGGNGVVVGEFCAVHFIVCKGKLMTLLYC